MKIKATRLNDGGKVEEKGAGKDDHAFLAGATGKMEFPLQSKRKSVRCWRGKKGNQELCFGQGRFEIVVLRSVKMSTKGLELDMP